MQSDFLDIKERLQATRTIVGDAQYKGVGGG